MFFVLFVFVFVFFYFFLLIYFISSLCKKNNLGFFDTLQANPDFSETLKEYIQLDFSNFCYELYFREIEIWGFIFFIQFVYISIFFVVFFLLISLIFIFFIYSSTLRKL